MNVNGVGGAASLPMTFSSPPSQPAPAVAATTTTSGSSSGEVRMPGQQRATQGESADRTRQEIPKPKPLPPLRGLTVAEIRAMLGVAPMPGQTDAVSGTSTSEPPSIMSAAYTRYV